MCCYNGLVEASYPRVVATRCFPLRHSNQSGPAGARDGRLVTSFYTQPLPILIRPACHPTATTDESGSFIQSRTTQYRPSPIVRRPSQNIARDQRFFRVHSEL